MLLMVMYEALLSIKPFLDMLIILLLTPVRAMMTTKRNISHFKVKERSKAPENLCHG